MIVIRRYPFPLKGLLGARSRRREARFKSRRIYFARWWELSLCSAERATTNSATTISGPLARHSRTRRATVNGRKLLIQPARSAARSAEFQLHCDTIERIVAAPGCPSFVSDAARDTAFHEVEGLIAEWEMYHLAKGALCHATKLLQQSNRFVAALFDQGTDALMKGTFPPRRLARLRQEFEEFVAAIEFHHWWLAELKKLDLERRDQYDRAVIRVPSFQDAFIKSNVVPTYETIYGATARRSGRDGTFTGPFIDFATAFFREVGHPVAIRTVSRALQRPAQKANPEQAVLGNHAKSVKLPN